MSKFTRTINIHSKDLGVEATLLLTFDDQPMPGMYQDYFPTAWRVATFGSKGSYSMTATYENQLAFMRPQFQSGKVVTASTWVDINLQQATTLTEDAGGVYSFSTPIKTSAQTIQAINGVNSIQSIGVGFDNGTIPPPITLLFKDVGSQSSVVATFTPILKAYIYSGYQQSAVIQGEIKTPVIWTQNLASLGPYTSWTLARDPSSGIYTITSDPNVDG